MDSSASASPPVASAVAPLPSPPPAVEWPAAPADCVLVLQHSERVPPAFVSSFLHSRKQPFHVVRLDLAGASALPAPHVAWRAVVALGGPQGSYEEALHPWLDDEKRFLRQHVEKDTPVLGICLGFQLLADALGGRVCRASRFEAGYVPLRVSAAGRSDPLLVDLFARLQREGLTDAQGRSDAFLLHHGDHVEVLPPGIDCLLDSEPADKMEQAQHAQTDAKPNVDCGLSKSPVGFRQLFRVRRSLGVQFHPESGAPELAQWTAFAPERYPAIGTSGEALVAEAQRRTESATRAAQAFFDTWWEHCVDVEATAAPEQQTTAEVQ